MTSVAPAEFRYRERGHRAPVRAIRAAVRRVVGFAPAPDGAVVTADEAAYHRGDPLAEAFVAEHLRGGPRAARAALDAALKGARANVTGALAALLTDIEATPTWRDRERV